VARPLARYSPSRKYFALTLFAIAGALLSAWVGLRWPPSWFAAVLFAVPAVVLLAVAMRPAIEIYDSHLQIGRRSIPWPSIRAVDSTGWKSPLAVHLTLDNDERVLLLYSGDAESSESLLEGVRRYSREALLDGIPYQQYWGESPAGRRQLPAGNAAGASGVLSAKNARSAPQKYPLLRPEDEEEVERLYQMLKSVGRMESKNSGDSQDL
jgi:hypothetical protein